MHPRRWLGPLGLVLGVLGLVVSVVEHPYLPSNDGPASALATFVFQHYADPDRPFREQFDPGFPLTSRGFDLFFAPLEAWLGWRRALLGTQVAALLVAGLGGAVLARAVHERAGAARGAAWPCAALLALALGPSWCFSMGFYSFTIGMGAGLALLGYVVARGPLAGRRRWLAVGALLVVSVLHVFPALFVGGVVALLAIFDRAADGGAWGRRVAGALAVLAPPFVVLGLTWLLRGAAAQELAGSAPVEWAPAGDVLRAIPGWIAPGPPWKRGVVTAAVLGCLALALRARGEAWRRCLIGAATAFLLLGVVAPLHAGGWQYFGPRLLGVGAVLAVAAAAPELQVLRVAGATSAAVLAVSVAGSFTLHRRLARGCSDAWGLVTAPVERRGLALPIFLDPTCGSPEREPARDVPYLAAQLHMGLLLPLSQGGSVPYVFGGSRAVHHLSFRSSPSLPMIPSWSYFHGQWKAGAFDASHPHRTKLLDLLAVAGAHYESLAVLGAPLDLAPELGVRGYRLDATRPTAVLASFVGCRVRVTGEPGALEASARVRFTVASAGAELLVVPVPPAGRALALRPLPCLDVVVEGLGSECRRARQGPLLDGETVRCGPPAAGRGGL